MATTATTADIARLVDLEHARTFHVLGPSVQYLTEPEDEDTLPCVMRGTIPGGVVIPMHSHPDPETFISVSGEVEGLTVSEDGHSWTRIRPGDVYHVPGGARHGFRNNGQAPSVMIAVSTSKLGRFFQEIGTLVRHGAPPPDPPTADALQRFLDVSARYGYWNATPEENEKVGIIVPAS